MMKTSGSRWMGVIGVALAVAALPAAAAQLSSAAEVKKTAAQAAPQGKGKVVSVDKAGLNIKLAHEEIKSLGWPAMTMDFKVANAALLKDVKTGDVIGFDLEKGSKPGVWLITRIQLHGHASPP